MNTEYIHPPRQSVVIRASAGSGKTYQLSLRFIALLALGTAPREIIALTFTRKAAGEFTERILRMLAEGASSDQKAADLAERIRTTWTGDSSGSQPGLLKNYDDALLPELDRERFADMLQALTRDLGRLNLSTLDSFFGNLARSLSSETGLNTFAMIDEARVEQLRSGILLSLFDFHNDSPEGREELVTAFRLATLGSDDDRIDRKMAAFVGEFHRMFLHLPEGEYWGNISDGKGRGTAWGKPPLMPKEFPATIERLRPLAALVQASDQWKKERLAFLDRMESYARTGEPPSLPSAYEPGKPFWENAARHDYTEIYRNKEIDLGRELGEGITALITSWAKAEILSASARTQGIYRLIRLYDQLYGERVREQGLFSFDDVTRLLLPDEGSDTALELEHLRYRMDGWFKHWMLDEFQDTSRDQWEVIRPFLEEVAVDTEGERSLFVVGDPKQSIYQWRGGEPRIFDSLLRDKPWSATLLPWSMDVSWRSSRSVLEFVNLVCHFSQTISSARAKALSRWEYNDHRPGKNNAELTGHVQVWQWNKAELNDEEKDDIPPILTAVSTLLQRIRPLERSLSCAVIVNTNTESARMSDWLRSEEGGEFLVEMDADAPIGEDSPLGAALADFFRWLNHPGDEFAWRHISLSPLGICLDCRILAPDALWTHWKERIDTLGIGGVMEILREKLLALPGEAVNEFQKNRLEAWLTAAREFDLNGGSLEEWISLMENMKRKEHSSHLAIRIMTVHKAKGLEFDIVVLPHIDNDAYDNKKHLKLLNGEDDDSGARGILLNPGNDVWKYDPLLNSLMENWAAGQEFEGFCKLYVALTRAKRATYAFVPAPPRNSGETVSSGSIIRAACDRAATPADDNLGLPFLECLYQEGSANWFDETDFKNNESSLTGEPSVLSAPASRQKSVAPSLEKQAAQSSDDSDSNPSVTKGNAIHALFERIDWLEDGKIPEFLEQDSSPEAFDVRQCLAQEQIRPFFTLPAGQKTLLWKEQPVAGYVNGTFYSGIIDRAFLSEGKLTVIDFKSNTLDSVHSFIDKHSHQLNIYASLLAKAFGLQENLVEKYILSTHLREIIPIF